MYLSYLNEIKLAEQYAEEENLKLHSAIKSTKCDKSILILFDKPNNGINVHFEDKNGCTALHMACQFGHFKVVHKLLKLCANVNKPENNFKKTALHIAIAGNFFEIALLLILNGADVNAPDKIGQTPIFYACQYKRLTMILLLWHYGADIEHRNNKGDTVLLQMCSAKKGDFIEIIKLLIIMKADVYNINSNNGKTAFQYAIDNKLDEIILLLSSIKNNTNENKEKSHTSIISNLKFDFNETTYEWNETFLHIICSNYHRFHSKNEIILKELRECIESFGDFEDFDFRLIKEYLLYLDVWKAEHEYFSKWICLQDKYSNQMISNTFSIIEILIKCGINVNKKNYFGETAIHLLCTKKIPVEEFSNCLKLLIDNGGGGINSHDNFDMTPLHHAIMIDKYNEYIPILLQNGAKLSANRKFMKTILNSYVIQSHKYYKSLINCMDYYNTSDDNNTTMLVPHREPAFFSLRHTYRNKYKKMFLKYYVYTFTSDVYDDEFSFLYIVIAIANRNNFVDIINYLLDNNLKSPERILYYLCYSRNVCNDYFQMIVAHSTESDRNKCISYFGNDIFRILERILYIPDCSIESISFNVTIFLQSIIIHRPNVLTIANDSRILTAFYYSNLNLDYSNGKLKILFQKADTVCNICTVLKEITNAANKNYCEQCKIFVHISKLFALCLIRGENNFEQRLKNICSIPEYGNSQCFKELMNLNKIKFDNTTITILIFLLADKNRSAVLVRNADILEQLSSTDFLKKVAPIYCDILQSKLQDSLQRHALIQDAIETIQNFNSRYLSLPDLPFSIICNLLLDH